MCLYNSNYNSYRVCTNQQGSTQLWLRCVIYELNWYVRLYEYNMFKKHNIMPGHPQGEGGAIVRAVPPLAIHIMIPK